jgi:hypothetical protein
LIRTSWTRGVSQIQRWTTVLRRSLEHVEGVSMRKCDDPNDGVRVRVVPKANRFQFHMVDECNGSKLGFKVTIGCLLWLLSETHGRCIYYMWLYTAIYHTVLYRCIQLISFVWVLQVFGYGLWFMVLSFGRKGGTILWIVSYVEKYCGMCRGKANQWHGQLTYVVRYSTVPVAAVPLYQLIILLWDVLYST